MRFVYLRRAAVLLACVLALSACAQPAAEAASPAAEASVPETPYQAPELALSPFHADAAQGEDGMLIDASCVSKGYVAASGQSSQRLKFQVNYGDTKYNYDLPGDGTPTSYPLQSGSGSYTFKILENTSGSKYAVLYELTVEVTLEDEFQPFIRPSQMVSYDADSACVAKAAELAALAGDDAGVVAQIYAYISENITYDTEKAATVADGYLPDPDETLAAGSGICYDYASLAAAMLRSQGIPTKLVTGYVQPGDVYHAWNMIWLQNTGWISVSIEAPANSWERIDLTFAAGADATYTGDGTGYTDRYVY